MIKAIEKKLASTEECIETLNIHYGKSAWKRKTKFKLAKKDVRVFTDGNRYFTVIVHENQNYPLTQICEDMDLSVEKPLIDEILKVAKNYWTVDYGQIYFNPWDDRVLISGGDSGIIYSTESRSKVEEKMEDGWEEEDVPNIGDFIPKITETLFEAEYTPPISDDDEENDDESLNGFIEIGEISVI